MTAPLAQLNGQSLRIPAWAITAAVAVITVFSAGYVFAQRIEKQVARVDALDARLCRIETALKIPPWPSCQTSPPAQ